MSEVDLVTSRKTKSRLLLKVLLGIFLLCAVVVAGIGLFLYQAEQSRLAESAASSANMAERMKLQAELMKYRDSTKLTQRELESEEMVACLERVPIDRATQKTRLRDAVKARAKVDPHLKTALLDVFNAPLVGDQPPVQYSDLVDEFMADVDLMLTRFSKRNPHLEDVSGIQVALRQCLSDAYRFDPPPEDDLERVKAAEADGDPIVLFTLFKADLSISEEGQWKRVTTASDRMAESPDSFDPIFAAFVHTEALRFHAKDKKSDGYDAAVRRFLSSWPAAWQEASKREPNTGRDHTCLTMLSLSLEHLNAAAQVDLVKGLANADEPSVPAYAVHLVVGDLFREVAFDHRGTKFVSETDASAMELFDKFATIASSHFVEAYLMRPELALLARRPLNMQMANGSTPLSVHHWFRLSLSGHIDHQSVYGTYSLALMPRWGGSEELQKRFAMKCLETKTEDGIVGMQSGRIMEDYLTRHTADVTMVDDPANVMWAKRSIDAWRTHLQCNRKFRCGILSAEFAMRILWEAGQFKEVAEFLEVLGDRSQDINWGKLNMDEAEVRFICQMADGPAYLLWMPIHLQLVFNSERLNDRNTSALHANLDELQTVWLDNSDFVTSRFPGLSDEQLASKRAYAKRVLNHRRTQLNLLERFHRGEMIHFTKEELAASFTPIGKPQSVELRSSAQCQREAAQIARDIEGSEQNQSDQADTVDTPGDERDESLDDIANAPGGFRVATDWLDYTFVLRNQIRYPLPASYEITATFIDAPKSPYGVSLLCGPDGSGGLMKELRGANIRFSPGGKFLLTDELPEEWGRTPIFRSWIMKGAKKRTRNLRLDIGRRGYRIFVDGEQIHELETPLRTEGLFQVGCASSRRFDHAPGIPMVFNVYDFRVQKLEEAPFEEPSYDVFDGLNDDAETNGFL